MKSRAYTQRLPALNPSPHDVSASILRAGSVLARGVGHNRVSSLMIRDAQSTALTELWLYLYSWAQREQSACLPDERDRHLRERILTFMQPSRTMVFVHDLARTGEMVHQSRES